ncbi:hypothetical protein [Nocardia sp. CNY236]|uniref:hypothetical protein n=1 Tax=Nocardia sp. CNY236 TaxID=1169152 RepID=UPI0003FE75FE|nr:hypothetical protein [Nocardia sp. CNY236]
MATTRAARLWQRLVRRRPAALQLDRTDLEVVASSFDDTESCSAALARATGLSAQAPAVLRHHLRIPAPHVESVCAIAAQEGYARAPAGAASGDALEPVVLQRVQQLDALHCAQERARMAGLAQRHDGHAEGWDALQPKRTPM